MTDWSLGRVLAGGEGDAGGVIYAVDISLVPIVGTLLAVAASFEIVSLETSLGLDPETSLGFSFGIALEAVEGGVEGVTTATLELLGGVDGDVIAILFDEQNIKGAFCSLTTHNCHTSIRHCLPHSEQGA